MSLEALYETFRSRDEALSPREQSQIQVLRLLFLLGALLCLLFIPLYAVSSPGATDPTWARVAVSALLAGIFAASYVSARIRSNFAVWARGAVYVVLLWFIGTAAVNGFSGDYEIGLLLLYAIFTVIAGIGARSIRPVLWFSGVGLLATGGAVVWAPVSVAEEAVLLGGMATVALVQGIAIHRLISTRKRLGEREARLRGLANSTPGVVFQFYARPDGTRGTHFVSEHAREVLGIAPDADTFYERFVERVPASHREALLQSVETVLEEKTAWQFEFPFEKPSGTQIWLLGTSAPDRRENELVFNGLLLDITERKEAETQLRAAKKEAEEASRVKTAMLANMSHEIRTPLTSILGFSEILRENLSGDLAELAERTHESSRYLSHTLESILQLSKLEAGAASLEREQVCLVEQVEETVQALSYRAEDRSIAVRTDVPERSVEGLWNANALRRIVRNLLENAIKFTPEGGQVAVRVYNREPRAVLEVCDTGVGISEDHLPHIFQAFRQESEGLSREYQGSGLGLSIVQHLVDELGGTIEVETEKGEGTCFTVWLPRATGASAGSIQGGRGADGSDQ